MADVSKPERDSSNSDSGCEEGSGNGPAKALRPVEEPLAWHNIPANLEVHRERADEDCRRLIYIGSFVEWALNLLHTAIDKPPAMRNAPENAHVKFENMSWGVISS